MKRVESIISSVRMALDMDMATMIVIRPGRSAKSICRLCFTEQDECQSIAPLKEWIQKLTSLTITDVDNAPYSICPECKATLDEIESFREMCFTNDRVFKDTFMPGNETKAEDGSLRPSDLITSERLTVNMVKKDASTQTTRISKVPTSRCLMCGRFRKFSMPSSISETSSSAARSNSNMTITTTGPRKVPLEPPKPTKPAKPLLPLFKCDQCDKHFMKRRKYTAHMIMHRHKYFCEYCGKGFPNPYMLNVHVRVHTGEKPFPCDVCGKAFFSRGNMYQHRENLHNGLTEFRCDLCGVVFRHLSVLKRHVAKKACVGGTGESGASVADLVT